MNRYNVHRNTVPGPDVFENLAACGLRAKANCAINLLKLDHDQAHNCQQTLGSLFSPHWIMHNNPKYTFSFTIHTAVTCGMLLASTACTSCTLAPVTNQPMCTKSVCYANKPIAFLGENFAPKIAQSFIMCICADASCACAALTA